MDKPRLNQLCFERGGGQEEGNLFADKTCHSKTVNITNEFKFLSMKSFFSLSGKFWLVDKIL